MVEIAVILAGGLGKRLRGVHKVSPKGFLKIEGKTLIDRSIEKILAAGIKKIIVGTGYMAENYNSWAKQYDEVVCLQSDRYETTSSMYTLYNLRNLIDGDYLLFESDLIYEKKALDYLLDDEFPDIILGSGKTFSGDEVYIEVNEEKSLVNMSKIPSELNNIYCELVGISKLSKVTNDILCKYYSNIIEDKPKMDYEIACVGIAQQVNLYVKKIEDLAWGEIDDQTHFERIKSEVLPKINERENL